MELVVAGVLYEAPKATFQAYMGGPQYARPKVLVGEVEVPGSMATVRTAAMLHGVLPLVAPSAVRALYAPLAPYWCLVWAHICSSSGQFVSMAAVRMAAIVH